MTEPAAIIASALEHLGRAARWTVLPLDVGWALEVGRNRDVEWAGYRAVADEPGSGFVVRGGTAFLSGPWISAAVGWHADLREHGWADGTVWVTMDAAAFRARGHDTTAVAQVSKELPEPGSTTVVDVTVDDTGRVHLDTAEPFDLGRRLTRCTVEPAGEGGYRFVSLGTAADGPAAAFSSEDVVVGLSTEGQVLTMEEALATVRAGRSERVRTPRRPTSWTVELMAPAAPDEQWTVVVTGHRGDARRSRAAGHELDQAVRGWLAARGDGALPLELDTSSDELFLTSPSRETLERLAAAMTAEPPPG